MDDLTRMAALRMIPYGIYVLTAYSGRSGAWATKVNWVTQTSFRPPLVAVAVGDNIGPYSIITSAGAFALNMLGKDQKGVARTFFGPLDHRGGRLNGQLYGRFTTGAPVLVHALATIECKVTATLEQGDHYVVVGEVIDAHLHKPLTGRPDAAILELKDLGDNVFYGG